MESNLRNNLFIVLFFLLCGNFSIKAQNIEVLIKGIRSSQGRIIIGIFKDEKSFKEDNPCIRNKFQKTKLLNGDMTVKFTLEPGIYGFSLLDDENDDDKMNFNIIGLPKEGFGFSNYYHTNLTRPKFDVFKFVLDKNQNQKIVMKIKYM